MNSEQEESADQLDESNANSSSNVDQSFDEKGNGPREHAKPRRRRRGKKRKQRKESAATGETENPEECEIDLLAEREHETHDESEYPGWDSDEHLSCEDDNYGDVNVILRPINVPSAPLNSTQFIIDDHNDCQFYMSFETPNPYGVSSSTDTHYVGEIEGDIVEPIGDDAAYIDIDYQYESPQDFDNSAYYDKDFELSYKSSRFEELLRSPRTELIGRLQALESRLKELTEDLMKENPSPILEKLQAELLELQEKNSYLKESNLKLSSVLQSEVDSSEPFSCQTIKPFSSTLHDEIESEDSEKEAYHECNEPEEIVMTDLNANPNSLQDESLTSHKETSEAKVISNTEEFHPPFHASELKNYSVDHSQIQVSSTEQLKLDKDLPVMREEVSKNPFHSELENNPYIDINCRKVDLNLSESKTESVCSSTNLTNTECLQAKNIHPNSCKILHSQPNNHVKDDLRTLNLSTSELLHITNQTKCSSLVPKEGGMSPSETSVN